MSHFWGYLKEIGPGAMVTAAFIGPGTITTCIKTGVEDGYSQLWVVLFSTIALIILQEMSSRLGIFTQMGLGENIRIKVTSPFWRKLSICVIMVAILCGNTAFEVGNLAGCSIGLKMINETYNKSIIIIFTSLAGLYLILSGSYKRIESLLTGIVGILAIMFLLMAFISLPDYNSIIKGLLHPSLGRNGLLTIMGIVGTTIGPYSLFLHASAATKKWHNKDDYKKSQVDTIASIGLGGLISMCIIITSASFLYKHNIPINTTQDFIIALNSIWGNYFGIFMGIALFLAGFSSAITATLGAAVAIGGMLESGRRLDKILFKLICLFIIGTGAITAICFGEHTIELILSAQILNAIILPLVIFFVIYCVNTKDMGKYRNTVLYNILSGIILIIILYISCLSIPRFVRSLFNLI